MPMTASPSSSATSDAVHRHVLTGEAAEPPEIDCAEAIEDSTHLIARIAVDSEPGGLDTLEKALGESRAERGEVDHGGP